MTNRMKRVLVGVVLLALLIATASVATARKRFRAPQVRILVRIEGMKGLSGTNRVIRPNGTITRNGDPAGVCPAHSLAGILDAFTQGQWTASWNAARLDYDLIGMFGQNYPKPAKYRWVAFEDYSPRGGSHMCHTPVRFNQHVLFAVVPVNGHTYPLLITGPSSGVSGQTVVVHVWKFVDSSGYNLQRLPAAGATVSGHGIPATKSDAHGQARIKLPPAQGVWAMRASGKGYIRSDVFDIP